jgi:hypothetical protein
MYKQCTQSLREGRKGGKWEGKTEVMQGRKDKRMDRRIGKDGRTEEIH